MVPWRNFPWTAVVRDGKRSRWRFSCRFLLSRGLLDLGVHCVPDLVWVEPFFSWSTGVCKRGRMSLPWCSFCAAACWNVASSWTRPGLHGQRPSSTLSGRTPGEENVSVHYVGLWINHLFFVDCFSVRGLVHNYMLQIFVPGFWSGSIFVSSFLFQWWSSYPFYHAPSHVWISCAWLDPCHSFVQMQLGGRSCFVWVANRSQLSQIL